MAIRYAGGGGCCVQNQPSIVSVKRDGAARVQPDDSPNPAAPAAPLSRVVGDDFSEGATDESKAFGLRRRIVRRVLLEGC